VVALRGGLVRIVYPDPADPLRYLELAEQAGGEVSFDLPGEEPFSIDTTKQGIDWDLGLLLRGTLKQPHPTE
jgi:hypothetical protein